MVLERPDQRPTGLAGPTGSPSLAPPPESLTVSGVRVDPGTMETTIETLLSYAERPGVDVAVGVNAHVCNLARHDTTLARFLTESAMNYADGQSVVWAGRALGGDIPERLATTDLAAPLCAAASRRRMPIFLFGGRPGVADRAAAALARHAPEARIETHHGYVDAAGTPALLQRIAAHGTKILFVGLGDPAQERWIAENRAQLPPLVLTCGGLFDWLSGDNRRAPRWMIRAGLEWMWRLMIEPRRLARRYIVGNPSFVMAVLRDYTHRRAPIRT